MILIGESNAQYANNLLGERKIDLRTDRDAGDSPIVRIYQEVDSVVTQVSNDVKIEPMRSDNKAGAKSRTDIHFNKNQIDDIISILKPYVDSLTIVFDDTPRSSPDPTGLEHPNGLSLGKTVPITWINGIALANYAENDLAVWSQGKIYIDAEKYSRGEKIHFGTSMSNHYSSKKYDYNCIELSIANNQLKRLLHTFTVAKIWLK